MPMPWAKMPSKWARVTDAGSAERALDQAAAGLPLPKVGLRGISWKTHGSSGTAALMVLFALATLSNLSQRGNKSKTTSKVKASYTDIQTLTGLSRLLISKALRLLEELEAVNTEREGNGCVYSLLGVDENGSWCALPQGYLMDSKDELARLKGIHEILRRPASLWAMKLYMILMAFRDRRSNTARMRYETITEYTGLRREDISTASQILVALQLIRIADDDEEPLRVGERRHNRYKIMGLTASG